MLIVLGRSGRASAKTPRGSVIEDGKERERILTTDLGLKVLPEQTSVFARQSDDKILALMGCDSDAARGTTHSHWLP
jgi:hypothetical protein